MNANKLCLLSFGVPRLGLTTYADIFLCYTRMHSSRMRTARFSGHLGGAFWRGGVCMGGVYLGGVHSPLHAGIHTPCEQNDRCKNITFLQHRLQAVKIKLQ